MLAIAGVQWLLPVEGMNVFFVLDRSDSIPSAQQDAAKALVNQMAEQKKKEDKAGVIIFGTDASIDRMPNEAIDLEKVEAVVDTQRSDLASAIRLATAAFAETGQKRIVLMSDGNENIGDAMAAVAGARSQGATVDVVPLGVTRGNDVFVQKVQVPTKLKKGQPFEAKIFVQADQAQTATVRLYRNEQFLGEQKVQLDAGKNLFSFPQTLPDQGFYNYDVRVDAVGDSLPQNNRAAAFASVKGDPRVLLISGRAGPGRNAGGGVAIRAVGREGRRAERPAQFARGDGQLRCDFHQQSERGRSGAGHDVVARKRRARFRRGPGVRGRREQLSRRAVIATRHWKPRCR